MTQLTLTVEQMISAVLEMTGIAVSAQRVNLLKQRGILNPAQQGGLNPYTQKEVQELAVVLLLERHGCLLGDIASLVGTDDVDAQLELLAGMERATQQRLKEDMETVRNCLKESSNT